MLGRLQTGGTRPFEWTAPYLQSAGLCDTLHPTVFGIPRLGCRPASCESSHGSIQCNGHRGLAPKPITVIPSGMISGYLREMGHAEREREEAMRPHCFVVFCDAAEIGTAVDPYGASNVASLHAKTNRDLDWQKYGIWRALFKGRLYEIRKLRSPRPAPNAHEYIRRPRRHG